MSNSDKHLTPERLGIINATAPAIAEKVADGTITKRFYEKMLGENPELGAFFNMSNQRSKRQPAAFGQAMFEPQQLQSAVLAGSVVASIEHLQNLEAIKGPALRIVHKHCALGILPHHYKYIHDYLLETTAEVLGDAVTPEVADAWSGAILHIAEFFIEQEKALYEQATAMEHNWDTHKPAEFLVRDVTHSARNMTSLYFERADGSPPPSYKPGQYITLCENPTDEEYFAPRHYTVAAPAPIGNALRICARHLQGEGGVPVGVMSTFVNTEVQVGDRLKFRHPFGVFTADLAAPFEQVAWVTAGAGITTALAMIEPIVQAGKRVVHWHADKDKASMPHAEDLHKAPKHASLRYYGGSQAFSVDKLVAQLADAGINVIDSNTAVFLCCPPAMILAVRNGLQQKGVAIDNIFYETFGPLAN